MAKGVLTMRAEQLAARTADAYSYDAYGKAGWLQAASMLLKRGYSDREAEAILRSKWTRWAGDMASGYGKCYGQFNGTDLVRFLTRWPNLTGDVAELVKGTFGDGGSLARSKVFEK